MSLDKLLNWGLVVAFIIALVSVGVAYSEYKRTVVLPMLVESNCIDEICSNHHGKPDPIVELKKAGRIKTNDSQK